MTGSVIAASAAIVAVFLAAAILHRRTIMARVDVGLDNRRLRKAARQVQGGGPDDWNVRLVGAHWNGKPPVLVSVCVLGADGDPDPEAARSLAAYIASTGVIARYLDHDALAKVIREVSP